MAIARKLLALSFLYILVFFFSGKINPLNIVDFHRNIKLPIFSTYVLFM